MNMTFVHSINLTNGNVSVYQYHDGEYLLRQRYNCVKPNCDLSDDGYSIRMVIKDTTFNIPEMIYHVEIDDNFTEFKVVNQFLPGIKKGNWPIRTLSTGL